MQLLNRKIIKASGADATRFLESIITNDIKLLANNKKEVIYTLMLTPQGRFLYDAFITMSNSEYLLEVDANNASNMLDHLNFYKLNSAVEFCIIEELSLYYIKSNHYNRKINYDEPRSQLSSGKETDQLSNNYNFSKIYKDPRFAGLGYRLILPGALETQNYSYFEDKYQFCIPDGFVDLVQNKSLPPEYGSDELEAISYTKGCYTGQEVISRTKYQGQVRKSLFSIEFDNYIDENLAGKIITQNDQEIGVITSNWNKRDAGTIAIGLVRTELLDINSVGSCAGFKCKIKDAPWRSGGSSD
ncbi:MAG: hypothetical protein SFT93_00470 [Rickettsiaceae bacterium]|nr:hypothetical protein [Rickettsiaceae bacterium]